MLESLEDVSDDAYQEDKLAVEIGYGLISMVMEGGGLPARVTAMRRSIARETGLPVAGVRIRDNQELGAREYAILVLGERVAGGELPGEKIVALNPENLPGGPEGSEFIEPTYGLRGVLVEADSREELERSGFMVVDGETILVTHLSSVINEHAASLLGRGETVRLLKATRRKYPGLVNDFLKSHEAGRLTAVLRLLLEERLPIGYIPLVLEVFTESETTGEAGEALSAEEMYARVRSRLKNILCADITHAGYMSVLASNEAPPEDETSREALRRVMRARMREAANRDIFPVVLTPGGIRLQVFRALAAGIDPSSFKVLCRGDIPYGTEIDIVGRLSVSDDASGTDDDSHRGRTYEQGRLDGFAAGFTQGLNLERNRAGNHS